ncbi:indoleamine 2,3-dioxygenase [Microdochium trichocladiopsis]|uniref:Indoleamine 2,3-dioxygenase n=1 Tax=Microdochium trichocladiopsis TaxID=1682393 RepID=A0A9P9BQ94_9PEZI|nr:indoleamine 2,3-dioxygenase [Microdochium trichocladiopsis]KAH7030707.1 indoleamine 2,3-dioxygenase [Microdochium trichocladiopsis]
MRPPIPNLADYGISPEHGFLPEVLPLARLPDPYYNKWEAVAANLQSLILTKRLRGVIDRLPVLSTTGLEHDAEWRRAYVLLTFFAHGYIWGGDSPCDRVPPSISAPLLAICEHLEVPPVSTYAASVLWNFKPLFVDEGVDQLDNLATLVTFSGSLDESWFYLVSVAIEARGGPIIPLMLDAIAAARQGDSATVTRCLRAFAERLDDLGQLLRRMHENCDPAFFYNKIRTFLAGSKNMADAGLPHGVMWDDGSGESQYVQYSGPSNAQSSLIQFFDVILGIEHRPTGEKQQQQQQQQQPPRGGPPTHNFIQDMRRYMPGPHARFLRDVGAVANIRAFVEEHGARDRPLAIAYDACLAMLRTFRDIHIAIVTRYIVLQSRQVRARSRSRSPEAVRATTTAATTTKAATTTNLATASSKTAQSSVKGTGGTSLIPFLKQARDETGEPAVGAWARRFMSRQTKVSGQNDFFLGKDEQDLVLLEQPVVEHGLAGTWTIDDDVGGICHY